MLQTGSDTGIGVAADHFLEQFRSRAGELRYLDDLLTAITTSKPWARCHGVRQQHLAYSELGRSSVCDRGTHQQIAAAIAATVAQGLGFSKPLIKLTIIGALIHDQGHPPFSHAGEVFLRNVTADGSQAPFCHDQALQRLLTQGKTGREIAAAGISVEDLKTVLHPNKPCSPDLQRVRYLITEVADRCAYVLTDSEVLRGIGVSDARVDRIQQAAFDVIYGGLIFSHNHLALQSSDVAVNLLEARRDIFAVASTSPVAELVRETICMAGSQVHLEERRRFLTDRVSFPSRFRTMTDAEALGEFREPFRSALGPEFEQRVRVLGAWPVSAIHDELQTNLAFAKGAIGAAAFQAGADLNRLILTATEDYSKHARVMVMTRSGPERRVIHCPVGPDQRLLIVGYLADDAAERYITRIDGAVSQTVQPWLTTDVAPLRDEILTREFACSRLT